MLAIFRFQGFVQGITSHGSPLHSPSSLPRHLLSLASPSSTLASLFPPSDCCFHIPSFSLFLILSTLMHSKCNVLCISYPIDVVFYFSISTVQFRLAAFMFACNKWKCRCSHINMGHNIANCEACYGQKADGESLIILPGD